LNPAGWKTGHEMFGLYYTLMAGKPATACLVVFKPASGSDT